jgi:hypothetical protein
MFRMVIGISTAARIPPRIYPPRGVQSAFWFTRLHHLFSYRLLLAFKPHLPCLFGIPKTSARVAVGVNRRRNNYQTDADGKF